LRTLGVAGRTVTLKVRFGDFHTITRSVTVSEAVDEAPVLRRTASALLEQVDPSSGVRLLGVSVSGLVSGGVRQLTLDDANGRSGWAEASRTVDEIRARFGADAIGPAALTRPEGLAVKRRGARQWGPGDGGEDRPSPPPGQVP
jgi:DNA polymerase IV